MSTTATAWVVIIPNWHPTTLNVLMRMHWAKRDRTLKAEYELVAGYFHKAKVPPATGKRRVTQVLTLTGRDKRRDDDGAWKGLLDAMVNAKMLVNDTPDWVATTPVEYDRAKHRATTILLEDMEPTP